MSQAPTIVHSLVLSAQSRPDDLALLELDATGQRTDALTYGDLSRQVALIAAAVTEACAPGSTVLLVQPLGFDLTLALLGCLAANRVPVPAPVPRNTAGLGPLLKLAKDCRPSLVATSAELLALAGPAFAALSLNAGVRTTCLPTRQSAIDMELDPRAVDPGAVAYLQYTSGSTLTPRGVRVGHSNLRANIESQSRTAGWNAENLRTVCWLPLFHDLGLVGHVLSTLWHTGVCALLSPIDFLRRPRLWLEAITQLSATFSMAPDFAYRLSVARVGASELEGLNLASWRWAGNGAEPVRADTLERFARHFAAAGFNAAALMPCYGLAEATLAVTGGPCDAPPVVIEVEEEALGRGQVVLSNRGSARVKRLVGCGSVATSSSEVRIVDPVSVSPLPEDCVGEIWVSGPSVALGYHGQDELTQQVFGARLSTGSDTRYLRTGDLGVIHHDHLFPVGRLKELIIVSGRNHYPQDIEATVGDSHTRLDSTACCAFAVPTEKGEQLVVMAEVLGDGEGKLPTDELVRMTRAAVLEAHGLRLAALELVPPRALPRTTSGKLRRDECRRIYSERMLLGKESS